MAITFSCKKCGQQIVADDTAAGDDVHCPKCGKEVWVPFKSEPTPPETPAPPPTGETRRRLGDAPKPAHHSPSPEPAPTISDAPKLIHCPDCAREVSKRAATCPHCGAPILPPEPTAQASSAGAMTCPSCKVQLVSKEKARGGVTLAGVFGGLLFVSGILSVFVNAIVGGGVLIVAGIIISVALRGKETVLVCPKCRTEVCKV